MTEFLTVNGRINKMRQIMKESGVDIYIVPTSDFHMSEYVSPYFQVRKYLSGFTGSAGTLIITKETAYLYTDGRYFIQAKDELKGSEIILMKMGEKGVPTEEELIDRICEKGFVIGFDGRVISERYGAKISRLAANHGSRIKADEDLAVKVWEDRPELIFNPIYVLEEKYCGESFDSKIARVREKMKEKQAETYVLTSLDDQAWLFNFRGSDIEYNPVFLAYTIVTMDSVIIYTGTDIPDRNQNEKIIRKNYFEFYEELDKISGTVMVDLSETNYLVSEKLKNASIVDAENPTRIMKAIKNKTELDNIKKCHVWDGVAVTKYMHWMKKNVGKMHMTEVSASEYLEQLRK